jgi:WD40 repeat protein
MNKLLVLRHIILLSLFLIQAIAYAQPTVVVQSGHSAGVTSGVFSPDSSKILTTSLDGTLRLWETATGREIISLNGHKGAVLSVAFLPDNKRAVSGSIDGTAILWDVVTGQMIRSFVGNADCVNQVAVSPDGRWLATAGSDGTSRVWDISNGKEVAKLESRMLGEPITSVAFSPDGKWLATANLVAVHRGSADIKLWHTQTWAHERTISWSIDNTTFKQIGFRGVLTVTFSPDSKLLLGGGTGLKKDDQVARIFDVNIGKQIIDYRSNLIGGFISAKFSPDARQFSVVGFGPRVDVVDTTTGKEITHLPGHSNMVLSIDYSPDSKHLLSTSADGTAILRSTPSSRNSTFTYKSTLASPLQSKASVALTPTGFVVGSEGEGIQAWNTSTGKMEGFAYGRLKEHVGPPRGKGQADWKLFAKLGFTGEFDRKIKSERNAWRETVFRPNESVFTISALTSLPGGKQVLFAASDHQLKLLDLQSKKVNNLSADKGHKSYVTGLAVTPDGGVGISSGLDKAVYLWDIKKGKLIQELEDSSAAEYVSASISADAQWAAAGGDDGVVRVWETAKKRLKYRLTRKNSEQYWSTVFSPDGKILATGDTQQIILWDMNSGKILEELKGHQNAVLSLHFSADGQRLYSSSRDATIRVWDLKTKTNIVLPDNNGVAQQIEISPDGSRLYAAGLDGSVRMWNTKTRTLIATFASFSNGEWVTVTHSGYFVSSNKGSDQLNIRDGEKVFGLEQYFNALFRPDNVLLQLAGMNTAEKSGSTQSAQEAAKQAELQKQAARLEAERLALEQRIVEQKKKDDEAQQRLTEEARKEAERLVRARLEQQRKEAEILAEQKRQAAERETARLKAEEVRQAELQKETARLEANRVANERRLAEQLKQNLLAKQRAEEAANKEAEQIALAKNEQERLAAEKLAEQRRLAAEREAARLKAEELRQAQLRKEAERLLAEQLAEKQRIAEKLAADAARKEAERIAFEKREMEQREAARKILERQAEERRLFAEKEAARIAAFAKQETERLERDRQAAIKAAADIELARQADLAKQKASIATIGGSRFSNIKPPPKIRLAELAPKSTEALLKLSVSLSDNGGGVGKVLISINGTAVLQETAQARALTLKATDEDWKTFNIRLVSGVNKISIVAMNAEGTMQSDPVVREVIGEFKETRRPTLHALVIGIQEFNNPGLALKYSFADADLFAATITQNGKELFDQVKITKLTTKAATSKDNIFKTIETMRRDVGPDDLFVFYVASHGTVDDGDYFLVTSNVGSTTTASLRKDAINQNELQQRLANVASTRKFIVLDTCNAEKLGESLLQGILTKRGMSTDAAVKVMSRGMGTTILSAATSQQQALEGYKNHGLFTYVVAQGLSGMADVNKDGFVKTSELADYLDNEVPDLAEKLFQHKQYPSNSSSGQSITITRSKPL